ncbi:MAG: succinylglutamate desuccinylase [Rhizobiales bacterium]|nr:succinylglutamate desuccinylase [Hyphomicrobiales bacterium]
MAKRAPFKLGKRQVAPGYRETIDLPLSVLSDHTPVNLSVHVVHGRRPGPTMFVSAAIHGDEIIGVEIVRRLLNTPQLARLRGTLLAVPIVNAFGFMNHSRYLPDRRDLNRSFPGSEHGSLAARLANLFFQQIVKRSDLGIDLHSAAIHRTNLPQVRVTEGSAKGLEMARAFGAPVILKSRVREGSLRGAASLSGVECLLFEAGEALRFDEKAIRAGVSGILRVMRHLEMLPSKGIARPKAEPIQSSSSTWLRSPAGGLLRVFKSIGDQVNTGDVLGLVSDPFGELDTEITATVGGLIVGRSNMPVINEGDGLFHIAKIGTSDAAATLDTLNAQLDADPIFDEDEII